ncbi:collagenase [Chitinimonas sp. BJB300]|uniref:collagenase n=2 Tax=Chitinimonas sp. BJB300 TaxID=1559339 RepID=UPI0027E41352|nr:collagenase [Chitinimonas sp. BJB300]
MFNTWKEITRIDPDDIYIQNKPKYVIDANKKVAEDTSYITAFKYFYDNNTSLMSTKYEEVLMDAVVSLAGGLNHEQLRSKIRPQIKEVLRGLDINSRGSSVYVAAVGALSSYDVDKKTRKNNCTEYDTCNIKERWVEQYMPSKKSCSPYIKIIAQPEISAERLEEACRLVLAEEKLFIYSLFGVSPDKAFMASGTKEKPKFDSGLEMILFKTKAMGWTPPQLTGIKVPNW